jgi:hypothetical protein
MLLTCGQRLMSDEKKPSGLLSPPRRKKSSSDEFSSDSRSPKKGKLEESYKTSENERIARSFLETLHSTTPTEKVEPGVQKFSNSKKGNEAEEAKLPLKPDSSGPVKSSKKNPSSNAEMTADHDSQDPSQAPLIKNLLAGASTTHVSDAFQGTHGMPEQRHDARIMPLPVMFALPPNNPVANFSLLKHQQSLARLAQGRPLEGIFQSIPNLHRNRVLQATGLSRGLRQVPRTDLTGLLGGRQGLPIDAIPSSVVLQDLLRHQNNAANLHSALNPSINSQTQAQNMNLALGLTQNRPSTATSRMEQPVTAAGGGGGVSNPHAPLLNLLDSATLLRGAATAPAGLLPMQRGMSRSVVAGRNKLVLPEGSSAESSLHQLPNQGDPPSDDRRHNRGRSIMIYMNRDELCLSKFQCLVRKHIELFEATMEDVEAGARGRNNPIVLGQVGIRCRYCSFLPQQARTRGAIYYPTKFDRVYQTAVNMAAIHLCKHCSCIPQEARDELGNLKDQKSIAGGGKDYWASGVRMLGVFETGEGLRFREGKP